MRTKDSSSLADLNVCTYPKFSQQNLPEFNETTLYSVQICIYHFYQFGIFYVKKRAYASLSQDYKYPFKHHPVLKKLKLGYGRFFQKVTSYLKKNVPSFLVKNESAESISVEAEVLGMKHHITSGVPDFVVFE